MYLSRRHIALCWLLFLGIVALSRPASADVAVSLGTIMSGDEWGFRSERYALRTERAGESDGQFLELRFHRYLLNRSLDGISPFFGYEPAVRLGGHVLLGTHWLAFELGLQGTADERGLVGQGTFAKAFPAGEATWTPRVTAGRYPLAYTPLPLSLGLFRDAAVAALELKHPALHAEFAGTADYWEPAQAPGRTQNAERTRIDPLWVLAAYAWVVTQTGTPFDLGLSARVAHATANTMLPTQLAPVWRYQWYPASAARFAWDTTLLLRAHGKPLDELSVDLTVHVPIVSQEVRQWEGERIAFWGTAPYEAKLSLQLSLLAATTLSLDLSVFLKPWEGWDPFGRGAYRYGTAGLSLKQGF